jgi:hypothetical protein
LPEGGKNTEVTVKIEKRDTFDEENVSLWIINLVLFSSFATIVTIYISNGKNENCFSVR